ncbi:MAG: ABC transporter substrate-binding protein, partial [Bdellovibrionota bacterium]
MLRPRLILLPLLLCSCTNHSLSPADTLTVELGSPTQTVNPLYTMDTDSQHVNELAHASLVVMGEHLTPEPYLAESFHYEGNSKIYFRLRKGCLLESGKEVTSDTIEKTVAYYLDPKNESSFAKTAYERIKKVEKINDYEFRLITDKPSPSLLTDLELMKILDLDGVEPGTRPQFLRGAGPYKVTSFKSSDIQLERSGQPCLPLPKIAKIHLKTVRDDLSRYLKLKRGELDLVLNDMNYRKVELIMHDPSLPMSALATDSASYAYMGVNQNSPNLRDPRVRLAIAKSFDLPELIKYKSRGFAKQARGMLADMNYYANLQVPIVTRDLEGARRLLDEAGYSNGSNGKPPLHVTLKTSAGIVPVENARVLMAQAKEAGIIIEHRAYDWGIFFADVKSGNTELYTLSWTGITDPHLYFDLFHSSNIGKNNRTRYKNAEMDKLIMEGDSELDPAKRRPSYLKIQELAAADLPFISLWHPKNTAV